MEHTPGTENAGDPFQNRHLAADMLGDWRAAAPAHGVSRKRKVNTRRTVLGVAAMSGSGFAYPGIGRRNIAGDEDGPQHQEGDREASFNHASKAEDP